MAELITTIEEYNAARKRNLNSNADSSSLNSTSPITTIEEYNAARKRNIANDTTSSSFSSESVPITTIEEYNAARLRNRATIAADNIQFDTSAVDFKENEPEASTYNLDYDGKRKKADLKKGIEAEQIRDYMIERFGEDYRRDGQVDNNRMVEDFFGHMRSVNSNALYTAGEARYVHGASDGAKNKMANAYNLYDSVGSVFVNDGVWGAVDGVKDYIFAAAKDPTNYLGFLTGGIAKGASMGVSAAGRALIKKAISEAAKSELKRTGLKEGADLAGKAAGDRMMAKLVSAGVSQKSKVAKEMMDAAAKREKRIFLREQLIRATGRVTREVQEKGAKKALNLTAKQRASLTLTEDLLGGGVKKSVYQTLVLDSTVAAMQDYHIQRNIYMPIGAQTDYSIMQTGFSSLLGGVGASLQLLGRGTKGASGYGGYVEEAPIQARRLTATNKEVLLLKGAPQKAARKELKDATVAWREKVERGEILAPDGDITTPLLKRILLGEDGTGKKDGILKVFKDQGIQFNRKTTISDVMTSVARILPPKELAEINKLMKPTGLTIGTTTQAGMKLEALIAHKIHSSGQTLNLMSQISKGQNAGVLRGEDILNNAGRSIAKKEKASAQDSWTTSDVANGMSYAQNVWRRLLVSSPKTTAVNVMGFASYASLNSVTDAFQAVGHLGMGSLKWLGDSDSAARHFRASKIHGQMIGQKLKNLADPLTVKDAYLAFLDQNKDVRKILRETYAGGIERTGKRFGMDPKNPAFKVTEAVTNGASTVAGVRAQDTLTKSWMMMTELDRNLRLKHNVTFNDVIEGRAASELIDEDIIGRSMDTTLKSVFSKDYTTDDQLLRSAAKLVENISNVPVIGTILPFGRFFNNVLGTAYQMSLGSLVGMSRAIGEGMGAKSLGRGAPADDFIQYAARALTTGTAIGLAMQFDKPGKDKGLDWNLKLVNGHIVDYKNVYPVSTFMLAGRMANNMVEDDYVPKENSIDALKQLGVGQFAKDIEFGNDLVRVMDALVGKGNEEGNKELLKTLGKAGGNILAGVTRPLDVINTMVGAMEGTDAARNIRLETGTGTFVSASTKYVDNIVQHFTDSLDSISGEELRVATREGAIRGPEPLLGLLGIKIVPKRTSAEIVYGFTNKFAYKANSRTQSAEYDNILSEFIAPKLDRAARLLLLDKNFTSPTISLKAQRIMAQQRFGKIFTQARKDVADGAAGNEGVLSNMRRKINSIPYETRSTAMTAFKNDKVGKGFTGGVDDMSYAELMWMENFAKLYKDVYK